MVTTLFRFFFHNSIIPSNLKNGLEVLKASGKIKGGGNEKKKNFDFFLVGS